MLPYITGTSDATLLTKSHFPWVSHHPRHKKIIPLTFFPLSSDFPLWDLSCQTHKIRTIQSEPLQIWPLISYCLWLCLYKDISVTYASGNVKLKLSSRTKVGAGACHDERSAHQRLFPPLCSPLLYIRRGRHCIIGIPSIKKFNESSCQKDWPANHPWDSLSLLYAHTLSLCL